MLVRKQYNTIEKEKKVYVQRTILYTRSYYMVFDVFINAVSSAAVQLTEHRISVHINTPCGSQAVKLSWYNSKI